MTGHQSKKRERKLKKNQYMWLGTKSSEYTGLPLILTLLLLFLQPGVNAGKHRSPTNS